MRSKNMLTALLCAVVCVAMLLSFAGCGSTPAVAITVDGKAYATGEYLAYLLDGFQQAYYNGGLYYYAQNGTDVWEQEYTGDNDEKVKLDEFLMQQAVHTVIRQKALENKLAEEKVEFDEELTKQAQEAVDAAEESVLLSCGISKENYAKMCMAYYRNELTLFRARYGKNGSDPVPETEIRKYFDDNYLSYKMISISMVDGDNKEFTEEKQKETKDTLQKYLDMYNNNKSFNDVIARYTYDTSTADNKELEKLTDEDTRRDMDAGADGVDEDLAKAIKSIPEGKAQIVTYSANGTTLTAALILRMDPEDGRKEYFENNRENILFALRYEAFDKEIDEYAKTLEYSLNDRAYKMCNPKEFLQD